MIQHFPAGRNLARLALTLAVAAGSLCPPSLAQAQPFSLLCMPDPQYYTTSSSFDLYDKQAIWIRNNAAAYNIKHVIWLGDLTNDNTTAQWNIADHAYDILEAGNISYGVTPGNHDYKTASGWPGANRRDLTNYNTYVGPTRFNSKPWYGGNMGNTTTNNENNYTFFESGGLKFMALALEYAPRKETITWANNLIAQHPDRRVIIYTHMYMTAGGGYAGGAGSSTATVGVDGSNLWNECASRHSNVFMVVCGHVTDSEIKTKTGTNGNTVYEVLVDYQGEKPLGNGPPSSLGNGWLRIVQFDPATNKINCSTITADSGNPALFTGGIDQFYLTSRYSSNPTNIDHLYSKTYNMSDPFPPYSYVNASSSWYDMSVGGDLLADQRNPVIGQASNGNWVAAWADDHDKNGIYRIVIRGFDSDGNERFAKSVVNTSGVNSTNAINPAIAMASDGRFVVAWQTNANVIRVRSYNADGTPATVEQLAGLTGSGTVTNPKVAMDISGNFVVTWAGDYDNDSLSEIYARGFSFNFIQQFALKQVNTVATGQQQNPEIAMKSNGDYIIAWEDDPENDGLRNIAMRGFAANESEMFTQQIANDLTAGQQQSPAIAMNDSGKFVVVWEDDDDLNGFYQVRARGFTGAAVQQFPGQSINVISSGNQVNPAVDMDPAGNWYPVWEDDGAVSSGEGFQIMANVWDINGNRSNSSDVRVNSVTNVTHDFGPAERFNPVISAHRSGRYIVAWSDDMDGDGNFQPLTHAISGSALTLAFKAVNGSVTKSVDYPFFTSGSGLVITAVPDPGYSFVRWTGDVPGGTSTTNPLGITMTSSRIITAEFEQSSKVGDWELY